MDTAINRCWRLAARPRGPVKDSDFTLHEEPIPEAPDGGVLVRTLYLSVDPTQRIWISRDSYLPVVPVGDVVRAYGVGRIVASKNPSYAEGDIVAGLLGWRDYAPIDASAAAHLQKLPPGTPIPMALSALGITGLTAYFGLLDVGRPKAGETVVVSGAAGATGMVVGQIAKLKGCRVIGIAGGPTKCAWVKDELGFDTVIDYKAEDVGARLAELCRSSIDIYFDNVGGSILDAALAQLALRGRIVVCGSISEYDGAAASEGIKNYSNLVIRRARMEGFLVSDYASRFGEGIAELGRWVAEGKIKDRLDVQEGLENAPATLKRLFAGANIGKQVLKIADA